MIAQSRPYSSHRPARSVYFRLLASVLKPQVSDERALPKMKKKDMTKMILARWMSAMMVTACMVGMEGCVLPPKGPGYRKVPEYQIQPTRSGRGETTLTLISKDVLAFEEVIERSPNVSSVAQVTKLEGSKIPGAFALSPDGESIIYQAIEFQTKPLINLWSTSTKGTGGVSRITAGNYFDSGPAFASDGSRVYFSSNRNSVLPRIWSVRSSGAGGISMLTQGESWDFLPCPEPKGDRVFYGSMPLFSTAAQVWSIGTDGGLPTQIAEGEYVQVSPDGQWLLCSKVDPDSGKRKIWKIRTDGVSPTQLTTSATSDDIQASWSPDGKNILFASDMAKDSNGNTNLDIWIMGQDGVGLTQLTTNGSADQWPKMASDGKTVYFNSNRGFRFEIWKMEISTAVAQ
jgi:Tol biopolymer transport system component